MWGTRTRHASRSHLDDFGDCNLPIPVNCDQAADPVSHGKYPCSHGHLRSSALAGCTGTLGCWLFPLASPLQGVLDPASNQSLLGRIFTGVLAGLGCSRYQLEWEPLSKSHRATQYSGQAEDRQTPVLTSSEWGLISERRGKRILRGKESRRAVERCESLKMAFSPKDRCAEPFSPFQQPPPHFPLSAPLLTASRGKVHPSTLSAPPLELPNLGRATASSISGDAAALSLPPSLTYTLSFSDLPPLIIGSGVVCRCAIAGIQDIAWTDTGEIAPQQLSNERGRWHIGAEKYPRKVETSIPAVSM